MVVVAKKTIRSSGLTEGARILVHSVNAGYGTHHDYSVATAFGNRIACDLEILSFGELNYGEEIFKASN